MKTTDYLETPRTFTDEEIDLLTRSLDASQGGNINATGVDDIQMRWMLMSARWANAYNAEMATAYALAWHDWEMNLDQRSGAGMPSVEPVPQKRFLVALDATGNHGGQAGWPTIVQSGPPVCERMQREVAKARTKPIVVSVQEAPYPGFPNMYIALPGDNAPVGHKIYHDGKWMVRKSALTRGYYEVVVT